MLQVARHRDMSPRIKYVCLNTTPAKYMHTHTHTCMYTEIYHMYEYHHMKQGTLHVAEHEDISSHTQYMYSHTTPEKYSHTCMYKEIYHMCIYRHVQRERLQVA